MNFIHQLKLLKRKFHMNFLIHTTLRFSLKFREKFPDYFVNESLCIKNFSEIQIYVKCFMQDFLNYE